MICAEKAFFNELFNIFFNDSQYHLKSLRQLVAQVSAKYTYNGRTWEGCWLSSHYKCNPLKIYSHHNTQLHTITTAPITMQAMPISTRIKKALPDIHTAYGQHLDPEGWWPP